RSVAEGDEEFVAAETTQSVLDADAVGEAVRERFEHAVGDAVAECTVDHFEVIEIDEQRGYRPGMAFAPRQGHVHPVDHQAAVGKMREAVMLRLVFELLYAESLLGDVEHGPLDLL